MDQLLSEAILDNLKRYYFTVHALQRLNFFSRISTRNIYKFAELEIGLLFCDGSPAKQRLRMCLKRRLLGKNVFDKDQNRL